MTRRAGDWVPTICKGGGMPHAPEGITLQTFLNQEHPGDPMPNERVWQAESKPRIQQRS
jgi:hypothetical protein